MKKLFTLTLILILEIQLLSAQKHFRTELRIRVENNVIIADLIALDNYKLTGFQFGFYHNSEEVNFQKISSAVLPNIMNKANEVCPRYVRTSWNHPQADYIEIFSGDIIITLHYEELKPSSHFICMMKSGNDFCKEMNREALDENVNLMIVDDVCASYRIVNGKVELISANQDEDTDSGPLVYVANGGVFIDNKAYSPGPNHFSLYNLQGQKVFQIPLKSGNQYYPLPQLSSGIYLFQTEPYKGLQKLLIR